MVGGWSLDPHLVLLRIRKQGRLLSGRAIAAARGLGSLPRARLARRARISTTLKKGPPGDRGRSMRRAGTHVSESNLEDGGPRPERADPNIKEAEGLSPAGRGGHRSRSGRCWDRGVAVLCGTRPRRASVREPVQLAGTRPWRHVTGYCRRSDPADGPRERGWLTLHHIGDRSRGGLSGSGVGHFLCGDVIFRGWRERVGGTRKRRLEGRGLAVGGGSPIPSRQLACTGWRSVPEPVYKQGHQRDVTAATTLASEWRRDLLGA